MRLSYPWLLETVRARFESEAAMEAFLPQALSPAALAALDDGRYLSAMTQRVFQAGMQHVVVDRKWPAFEEVFGGFEPEVMVQLDAAALAQHLENPQLIRHQVKLQTIRQNAQFILDVRRETGQSFAVFIAGWPVSDIIGLWRVLAKRGSRLGGRSSAGFLRLVGKDSFLLTSHVVARLVAAGIVTRTPSSQRDLQAVQDAFNRLQAASGRPLCQLSAMLALSIHPAF